MSASPMARAAAAQDIPRRVVINNEEDMPSDYSTTPGGTMFGTTPGGTRIVYERAFLINMRNSPLAKTPPKNLPNIPGVTSNLSGGGDAKDKSEVNQKAESNHKNEEDDQFSMDI